MPLNVSAGSAGNVIEAGAPRANPASEDSGTSAITHTTDVSAMRNSGAPAGDIMPCTAIRSKTTPDNGAISGVFTGGVFSALICSITACGTPRLANLCRLPLARASPLRRSET